MARTSSDTPKEGPKVSALRLRISKFRAIILAVVGAGLLCLVKMFSVTEEAKLSPELEEQMRVGEVDIWPNDLERMDRDLIRRQEPLYPVLFERVEMSSGQRRILLEKAVDKQLAPYVTANRTFTPREVDRLKKRINFSVRVIKDGENLTFVQTEQEKENWAYWYRMDQTSIAFKAMHRSKMLPPRFDLVVNLNDEPNMSQRDFRLGLPPLFSYCSTGRNLDLVWVGWQYWRCLSPRHWEDFMAEPDCPKPINITESILTHPWVSRNPKALWRGSPTGQRYTESNWREKSRPRLAMLSKKHPDILNCTMTKCQEGQCTEEAEKEMEKEIGYVEDRLTRDDYLRHKYLVDVDGNSFSARFPELVSTGALVFKQESRYEEFLDLFFQPGRHYVRINKKLDNLVKELRRARRRDRRAELMAARSVAMLEYILENDVVFEYLQTLLEGYAKLLRWED